MKFLDTKGPDDKDRQNKMQEGNRIDQRVEKGQPRTDPKVMKLASDMNVDLANVEGTGKNGQITESDVRKAAASGTAKKPNSNPTENITSASGTNAPTNEPSSDPPKTPK